jgi:hypothetical protein
VSAPNVIAKKPLLAPEYVEVTADGELVTIRFGNVPVTMHYEAALKIAQFIRVRAKEAKRKAGDVSRHWSAIATLDGLK